MATKPKYILDLERKVDTLHQSQTEMKSNYDQDTAVHATILLSLTEIKICLKGTEFDSEAGGLVKQVNSNAKCISHIKRGQAKREGIIVTVATFITGVGTLVLNWLLNKS